MSHIVMNCSLKRCEYSTVFLSHFLKNNISRNSDQLLMNTDVKGCMRIHVEGFGKLKVASCLYTGTFAAKPQTTGLTLRPRHSIYYQHGKGYSVFYLYEASVLFSALKSSRLMLIRQHSDCDNERIASTRSTEAFNP